MSLVLVSSDSSAPDQKTTPATDPGATPMVRPDPAALAEKNRQEERVLKKRFIGMVLGLVFAHVYVALALAYSYMDDHNHLHTCWLPLLGAFICGMIFVFHVSIS
ncbi:hypothetical protein [Gluconobacter roseus]|uniref:2TM domain-containing protein n=1 Tax=Gluconobacter roseus NBRC 3990 TaxID=1307950 RepID=A0A4Y3M8F5_9PROT|nr:hypothetical protein [Gluconobacter roseus]KXV42737.1 hypothetical protein AD943_11735 [Gluconobacter roseus]GBR49243.1 hypothetical protein AA3990_2445 [Gluconobacter roseus NBRC 3990]GEB04186.1 hypothetical protein GRO01_17620 [Gluconobacter roseus NBRC 3990]GLP92630.1 hypothetical protein GCM10007871_06080 [Gluconobacter roseus NBRC 3990]